MHVKWLMLVGALTAPVTGCAYGVNGLDGLNGMDGLNGLSAPHGSKGASAYDGRVDFSRYYTFFILDGHSSGDPLTDERLFAGITDALISKGWVAVPAGSGRAAVVINIATGDAHTDDSFYRGWGGWQWRGTGVEDPSPLSED